MRAQLEGIVNKIKDVVNNTPRDLRLEIVITSDHGRILATSPRQIPVPPGLKSHGRAAWGPIDKPFPALGYFIDNNLVYIHPDLYGLEEPVVMPMDETTFQTSDGRGGSVAFTHGGLYPEEVIVPWLEFIRDVVRPLLTIKVTGSGEAQGSGILKLEVMNLSAERIKVESLEFSGSDYPKTAVTFAMDMPGHDNKTIPANVSNWPTKRQARSLQGKLRIMVEQGISFIYPCDLQLEVNELYSTSDEILDGLI